MKKLFNFIRDFSARIMGDFVGAFAAQSAFFIIIAFIPFLMLLITLVQFLPLSHDSMRDVALTFLPQSLQVFVASIVDEIYTKGSFAIISVTAVSALWSVSKGMLSMLYGLQVVYHIKNERNYFYNRLISMVYTLGLIVILVLLLAIFVFGNSFLEYFSGAHPKLYDITFVILNLRTVSGIVLLTAFFVFLYAVIPGQKTTVRDELPGAVVSAICWVNFSYLFSVYVSRFGNFSYLYGSLTMVVLLMLWVYFCLYLLFIGAEINAMLRDKAVETE